VRTPGGEPTKEVRVSSPNTMSLDAIASNPLLDANTGEPMKDCDGDICAGENTGDT